MSDEPQDASPISAEESARRRDILKRAQRLVESEGLEVPAKALERGELFIAGKATLEELRKLR